MRSFITQTTSENPTILVIGDDNHITLSLRKELEKTGLVVVLVSPEYLDKPSQKLLEKNYYKIIYSLGFLSKLKPQKNISDFLKKRTEPAFVIGLLETPISKSGNSESASNSWIKTSRLQAEKLSEIEDLFPKTLKILGRDVVDANGLLHPIAFSTQDVNKFNILDHNLSIPFQTTKAFINLVAQNVFKPSFSGGVLIQGLPIESGIVASALLDHYQSQTKTNISVNNNPLKLGDLGTFKVVNTEESSDFVLKKILKSLPENTINRNNKNTSNIVDKHLPALKPDRPKKTTKPDSSLDEELLSIFGKERVITKEERIGSMIGVSKRVKSKEKRKKSLFYGGLVFLGVGLGATSLIGVLLVSSAFLEKQLSKASSQLLGQGYVEEKTSKSLEKITKFVDLEISSYSSLVDPSFFSQQQVSLDLSIALSQADTANTQLEKLLYEKYSFVVNPEKSNNQNTNNLVLALEDSYKKTSRLEALLLQKNAEESLSETPTSAFDKLVEKIVSKRKSLAAVRSFEPILEPLFGQEERRVYAVVLQDTHELRPTGGVIRAVGLLTFDKGSLQGVKVYSASELDNLLVGAVVPPDEVSRFIQSENWLLSESNWDPDFAANSKRLQWFLEKMVGVRVDGVIGMNLFTLEKMLDEVGSLEIQEHGEVLTSKNVQERFFSHSEVRFGSSQSSSGEYSKSVLSSLLTKIQTLPQNKLSSFFKTIFNSSQERELLFSFFDDDVQQPFSSAGWGGGFALPHCPGSSAELCVVDTLAQVETNIGLNTVNYFVQRSIEQNITLGKSEVEHRRKITFTNTAHSSAWPQGEYRVLTKIFLPKNASFKSVTIDGNKLADVGVSEYQDKKVVAFVNSTPNQARTEVLVSYSVPHDLKDNFTYSFVEQRQPGVRDTHNSVVVGYSPTHKPQSIAPKGEVVGNEIHFTSLSKAMSFVAISFKSIK